MSISITVPDTHVRNLSDAVLADRLTRDLVNGWYSGSRIALVGGWTVAINDDGTDMRDWARHLTGQKPGTATVDRHRDGVVDIVLSDVVSVHLLPRAVTR